MAVELSNIALAAALHAEERDPVLNQLRDVLYFEYPQGRLRAQKIYDDAALKVQHEILEEHAQRSILEEKVRKEESKKIKDFNECKSP